MSPLPLRLRTVLTSLFGQIAPGRRHLAAWIALLLVALLSAPTLAGPFIPGDLVVYRVGDGTGSLVNTGSAVFLDEYTPTGTLVQSILMPTTKVGSQYPLIASGTATSEGGLSLSADGRYLLLTGYGTTVGGSSVLAITSGVQTPRVVGRVDGNGNVDTSTALTDFADGNNPRSAVSTNGTDIWASGAASSGVSGVRYATLGSTTSTPLSSTFTNGRQVAIFDGQLYVSSGSSGIKGISTVGMGLPTTAGQTVQRLPGLTDTSSPSPYSFLLADLSAAVPGLDTLYTADDDSSNGGIRKYSLVGESWVYNGKVGSASNAYRGLTGTVNGSSVTLYTTRRGGNGASGGGELATVTDASGYNLSMTGSFTLLATAPTNEAFRGVAFAPTAPPVTAPEPSTLVLLIAAAAGMICWICRRRR